MACPTPWKDSMTKREAKRAVRDMRTRARRSKHGAPPVSEYPCPCGMYHVAGNRYKRGKMV
jgi:hypothetical protein